MNKQTKERLRERLKDVSEIHINMHVLKGYMWTTKLRRYWGWERERERERDWKMSVIFVTDGKGLKVQRRRKFQKFSAFRRWLASKVPLNWKNGLFITEREIQVKQMALNRSKSKSTFFTAILWIWKVVVIGQQQNKLLILLLLKSKVAILFNLYWNTYGCNYR